MTDRNIAEIAALVAEILSVPAAEIDGNTGMANMEKWDSVAQLNICLAFQERFGVEIDMEAIAAATSVAALAGMLPDGR
jgi:acyl carrier protein